MAQHSGFMALQTEADLKQLDIIIQTVKLGCVPYMNTYIPLSNFKH